MPDKVQHGNWRDSLVEVDMKGLDKAQDWNNFEEPQDVAKDHFRDATKKVDRGRRIAEEAIRTINGERQDQYGNPEDTFQLIADLWSAYLGNPAIQAEQVADMMILLKIAREAGGKGKKDNMVDLIGYAMLGASMRGYDA